MYREIVVNSNDSQIICQLFNDSGQNSIIVILTGDSPKGIDNGTWPILIKQLVKAKFCVYAIDFYSQGRSEGAREQLTIEVGVENLKNAFASLKVVSKVEGRNIGFIASSFGAAVLLNADFPGLHFDAVVFKSPAITLSKAYEREIGSQEDMLQWKAEGTSKINGLGFLAYKKAVEFDNKKREWYFEGPVLFVQGAEDEIVSFDETNSLHSALASNSEFVVLDGVKHNYKQNNGNARFNELALDFFKSHFN